MVHFKVVPPKTKGVSVVPPAFVLEQDNWNDYSFQTQYHLSYHAPTTDGGVEITSLGPVKILRRGQTKADGLLVQSDFHALDSLVDVNYPDRWATTILAGGSGE